MWRSLSLAVLSLLLLSMQYQGQTHAIAHLEGAPNHSQESGFTAPADEIECLECALLAGGLNGALSEVDLAIPPAPISVPTPTSYPTRAVESPAWFQSRAPPSPL